MDAQQIKVFIDAMAASNLGEMQASKDGWSLRLVRTLAGLEPVVLVAAPAADLLAASATHTQHATLSGVVFWRPAPDQPAFVQPGQTVTAGQTVCVIEAMKIFIEVAAECDGTVQTLMAASGQEVDAGQPLLRFC